MQYDAFLTKYNAIYVNDVKFGLRNTRYYLVKMHLKCVFFFLLRVPFLKLSSNVCIVEFTLRIVSIII